MEVVFIVVLIIATLISIGHRRSGPDPIYRPVVPVQRKRTNGILEPQKELLGIIDTQEGFPVVPPLTLTEARRELYNIVNGDSSIQGQERQLDDLYSRVNKEMDYFACRDLIVEIKDERIHLWHPDWEGNWGDFRSVKQ